MDFEKLIADGFIIYDPLHQFIIENSRRFYGQIKFDNAYQEDYHLTLSNFKKQLEQYLSIHTDEQKQIMEKENEEFLEASQPLIDSLVQFGVERSKIGIEVKYKIESHFYPFQKLNDKNVNVQEIGEEFAEFAKQESMKERPMSNENVEFFRNLNVN